MLKWKKKKKKAPHHHQKSQELSSPNANVCVTALSYLMRNSQWKQVSFPGSNKGSEPGLPFHFSLALLELEHALLICLVCKPNFDVSSSVDFEQLLYYERWRVPIQCAGFPARNYKNKINHRIPNSLLTHRWDFFHKLTSEQESASWLCLVWGFIKELERIFSAEFFPTSPQSQTDCDILQNYREWSCF